MNIEKHRRAFTEGLLDWHHNANNRQLLWKGDKDPYRIWLSEIILQQTRAEQGAPYFTAFTEAYPTVGHLAAATDEDAFRLWQGLGYYNRCRNLLATARYITNELAGKFPDSYDGLLALKGVGPYTAAAIASFAYGLPHAVVDGNVYRVLARYFGIETPFDTTEGKKEFQALADVLIDAGQSSDYNQGIMDFGATVCTPLAPSCNICPLQKGCVAYRDGLVSLLPVRSKKQAVRPRYFHYIIFRNEDRVWVRQRSEKGIWQGLHEPYLIEADKVLDRKELMKTEEWKGLQVAAVPEYEGSLTQRLSHQLIETKFFSVQVATAPQLPADGFWAPLGELKKYAFPKTLVSFFEKNEYF